MRTTAPEAPVRLWCDLILQSQASQAYSPAPEQPCGQRPPECGRWYRAEDTPRTHTRPPPPRPKIQPRPLAATNRARQSHQPYCRPANSAQSQWKRARFVGSTLSVPKPLGSFAAATKESHHLSRDGKRRSDQLLSQLLRPTPGTTRIAPHHGSFHATRRSKHAPCRSTNLSAATTRPPNEQSAKSVQK